MRVFVTGGTGAIGGHAVPALLAAGHTVTALARTPDKAAGLRDRGATPVTVSIFDREALTSAFAGYDAVVNLASAIPPMSKFMSAAAQRENHRVRAEGSAAVVDAALAAGVGRAGVVLRFGWFYGPGAAHSEQMYAQARHHVGMVLGRPDGYVSSIHLADAATAVVAALEAPAGTYNVVDDEPLTKREYADALARAAGVRLWLRVPGRAAYLFGDRLTSLTRSLRVGNARFREATGWTPRYPSAREGWLATATMLI